jgi:hypothetical protein
MRSYIIYRTVNRTPRRLLSVSSRILGGEYDEHDDPAPREFLNSLHFLSGEQRPNPVPLTQEDMTPELIAEKAKKYNMLPEDYYPMSLQYDGATGGDYPVLVTEHIQCRPGGHEWDWHQLRRNYGQPVGFFMDTHYGNISMFCDQNHMGYFGIYQYWQHYKIIFGFIFYSLLMLWGPMYVNEASEDGRIPIIDPILDIFGYSADSNQWITYIPFVGKMIQGSGSLYNYGEPMFNREEDGSWNQRGAYRFAKMKQTQCGYGMGPNPISHQSELEFADVWKRMSQAKHAQPGHDSSHVGDWTSQGGSNEDNFFSMSTTGLCRRMRYGPSGQAFIMAEKQDLYMTPAGPCTFKAGHINEYHTKWKNGFGFIPAQTSPFYNFTSQNIEDDESMYDKYQRWRLQHAVGTRDRQLVKDFRKNKEYFDIELFNQKVYEEFGTSAPAPGSKIYVSSNVFGGATQQEEEEDDEE